MRTFRFATICLFILCVSCSATTGKLLVVHERRDGQRESGVIDLEGNLVMPFAPHEVLAAYPDGYLIVRDRGKQGVMDLDGDWVIEPKYDTVDVLLGEAFSTRSANHVLESSVRLRIVGLER